MALKSRKQLHVHIVPFMLVAVGFVVLALAINVVALQSNRSMTVKKMLGVRLYDIQPASNGLAHISRHVDASAQGVQIDTGAKLTDDAGHTAVIQASLYSDK